MGDDRFAEPTGRTQQDLEVSVVLPCLNEADTLATCIRKAKAALVRDGIASEIIVADNGSRDGSRQIAIAEGARLVEVAERGYGSALIGGITASRGRYVIMGDADDSYNFGELGRFVAKLREGNELVQGCRLPRGGGTIKPGAMPFLHRWVGNPCLTYLARSWFQAPVNDVYCGMRGFSRGLFERLELRCTGMEFAVEMIVKSSLRRERIAVQVHTKYRVTTQSGEVFTGTFNGTWPGSGGDGRSFLDVMVGDEGSVRVDSMSLYMSEIRTVEPVE